MVDSRVLQSEFVRSRTDGPKMYKYIFTVLRSTALKHMSMDIPSPKRYKHARTHRTPKHTVPMIKPIFLLTLAFHLTRKELEESSKSSTASYTYARAVDMTVLMALSSVCDGVYVTQNLILITKILHETGTST